MSFLIENKIKTIQYALVWLLYAFLHAFSLHWVISLPFWMILTDAFIHALLFAAFGILLWNVLLYGNYDKTSFFQRMINYSALAFLSIGLWIALGYGFGYICFGEEAVQKFIPFLPLYGLLGIFIFLLTLLSFQRKIAELRQSEDELEIEQILPEIKNNNESEPELLERIAVKSGHKIHVILVSDIIYLQADGDYVWIHTTGGKFLKEQTMKYLQENLSLTQFVRVHRSYIVNIEAISRIEQYEKQNQLLTLKNGDKIKVSIAGYKLLKMQLGL